MGSLSIWHWLIVLAIVLVVFGGRGRVSDIMGDFGKGIRSFKKGLGDEDAAAARIQAPPAASATPPVAPAPAAEPVHTARDRDEIGPR